MTRIDLNGTWTLTGNGLNCTGNVPGSVYSFLLNAGLMEDPFYRENEWDALALMEHSYTFTRSFTMDATNVPVTLCCDGLDTLCTITLNGVEIASTQNMHRRYAFDVTKIIKAGENNISLRFDSPTNYVRTANEADPIEGLSDAYAGYMHLRKAQYMFGWDWGPMLPDAGIWRNIYLLLHDSAQITDLRIRQQHIDGNVWIIPHVTTDKVCDVQITLHTPAGNVISLSNDTPYLIEDPQLWWPNGMGSQPLYEIHAAIIENGNTADLVVKRIGLRTLRLIREKDRYGESFCHEINGVRIFAMGADYIPEDNILSRCTPARSRHLLEQAVKCNFNTIRIWGGGYYPDDWFLDLCDEMGLMIFQDMMVACRPLPDNAEIKEEFTTEVRDNLLRIRHHPCIALISGNNEVEQICTPTGRMRESYLDIFEGALPQIIQEVCPEFDYIPSSPTTCGHFIDPSNENYGDSHYWQVWHGGKPFTEYRKHYFRYLSEFGMQSFPCQKTVDTFTIPSDQNIFSRVMERHQRNGTANGKILMYLSQTYLYPSDFSTLLYTTQLLQATSIRYGVEHLRRNRGRCMGALYWQFNDCWPVASWASIDSCGRYKALQYYAKRFFAPIMISCEEIGETFTRSNVNKQPDLYDYKTTATLSVNNDTTAPVKGRVVWTLRNASSEVLQQGEQEITVPALSVTTLDLLDFQKTDVLENHLSYSFLADGTALSCGSVLFTAPKHYRFVDPKITWSREGNTITVFSESYAQSVEIDSPDSDFVLSDNYFDMERGSKTLQILEGNPKTITVRSVYDIR